MVDALRIARELAAKRLEAEMKKLGVGLTTNYFVLQYQEQLATARSNEIRALVDYNVSLARLDKATGKTLESRNIAIADAGK
jgi:outer membrane protein TolC